MKIAIIGGGASGLFCASNICDKCNVTIYEKNEQLGKKLLITGNGRCNVTNLKPCDHFLNNVVTNAKFLHSCINTFSPQNMYDLLHQNGIELVEEENNKIYPKNGKAKTILEFFCSRLGSNVQIKFSSIVEKIEKQNNKFIVTANGETNIFDKVIIATGGCSYPATGSSGDGYEFAKNLGHNVVTPRQSLCALITETNNIEGCAGVQFQCRAGIVDEFNKLNCEDTGWIMITHKGLSGPLIFTLTAKYNNYTIKNKFINIDFAYNLNYDQLKQQINDFCKQYPNCGIFEYVSQFFVKRFALMLKQKHNKILSQKACMLSNDNKKQVINLLKNYKIKIINFDEFNYSIVTKGGVSVKEINPKTMESKLNCGLYFIGEVIDVDALTGGYSLQIAFSTAYACAQHINSLLN